MTVSQAGRAFLERARGFLLSRRRAYRVAFDPETSSGRAVLEDLSRFCRAHDTAFHPDPRMHAVLEGRREVWLRIQQHLQLTEAQLWALYGRRDLE